MPPEQLLPFENKNGRIFIKKLSIPDSPLALTLKENPPTP
jgi:hypothetical protein